jgi:hypothetical protein
MRKLEVWLAAWNSTNVLQMALKKKADDFKGQYLSVKLSK